MNIKKISWLTDIHLNFLSIDERKIFYQNVDQSEADIILITGDIAEAPSINFILNEFSNNTDKKIYFVLGNHDYYFGRVTDVRENLLKICSKNHQLTWLGKPEIINLNDNTILIGHDGWADARCGDFDHSTVNLNDSRLISELYQAFLLNKKSLKMEMQKLADTDAKIIEQTLRKTIKQNIKNVIIATHVPPFPECCFYNGKPSDNNWLPYFSSKATGDVVLNFSRKYPTMNFLVLCGHTHGKSTLKISDNLNVKTGFAQYNKPDIQEILSI